MKKRTFLASLLALVAAPFVRREKPLKRISGMRKIVSYSIPSTITDDEWRAIFREAHAPVNPDELARLARKSSIA